MELTENRTLRPQQQQAKAAPPTSRQHHHARPGSQQCKCLLHYTHKALHTGVTFTSGKTDTNHGFDRDLTVKKNTVTPKTS